MLRQDKNAIAVLIVFLAGTLLYFAFPSICTELDKLIISYQKIAHSIEDRIEITKFIHTCEDRFQSERVYFPISSHYISFCSTTEWGMSPPLRSISFGTQLIPKKLVHELIQTVEQSKGSSVDLTQLGLTQEKIQKNWLKQDTGGEYDGIYSQLAQDYKLQVTDEIVQAALQDKDRIYTFASGGYSILITKPAPLIISGGDRLPWSINYKNRHWYSYNRTVSFALGSLLAPNNKPIDLIANWPLPQNCMISERRLWNSVQAITVQKNAAKIVLESEPFPRNSGLVLTEVTIPVHSFTAKLKPLKIGSVIDEVRWEIYILNGKVEVHWDKPVNAFSTSEKCAETIKWLKSWKLQKYTPIIQLGPTLSICDSKDGVYIDGQYQKWQQLELDQKPNCLLTLFYKGQERGHILTSSSGDKVYVLINHPLRKSIEYYEKHKILLKPKELLLSKQDTLPKHLAEIFGPNSSLNKE